MGTHVPMQLMLNLGHTSDSFNTYHVDKGFKELSVRGCVSARRTSVSTCAYDYV